MTDGWTKFQSKKTSFAPTMVNRTSLLCFNPYAKKSVLEKYNLTIDQFIYYTLPEEMNFTWTVLAKELYYNIDEDFEINYLMNNNIVNVKSLSDNVTVERVLTFWSGYCYKISLNYFNYEWNCFAIQYKTGTNGSLLENDVPKLKMYLTSEENAYGVLALQWMNGVQEMLTPDGYINDFHLTTTSHKYLGLTSECNENYNKCVFENLLNGNYSSCEKKCMPIDIPKMDNLKPFPICETMEEFLCMKKAMYSIYYEAMYDCPNYCNTIEYSAKPYLYVIPYKNAKIESKFFRQNRYVGYDEVRVDYSKEYIIWTYTFPSKQGKLHEEYLLYDGAGILGVIGGTLGIFVGWSFRDITSLVFDKLRNKCRN